MKQTVFRASPGPREPSRGPFVRVEGVERVFVKGGEEIRAVDGVDLVVEKGEFVILMGASGSGKSTLLNCLGGLDSPTAGRIVVDGMELGQLDQNQLADYRRQKVGFIFQAFHLIPTLTVVENVMLPLAPVMAKPAVACRWVLPIITEVGMAGRIHHLPGELSGGEQQRVSLARALVNQPALLLADEPTGNLDAQNGERILGLLQRLNAEHQLTIILATHDPRVAERGHRILTMDRGRIVQG